MAGDLRAAAQGRGAGLCVARVGKSVEADRGEQMMIDHPYAPETLLPYLLLVVELAKAIAWPASVLLIFFVLREPIATLLSRIRNLSAAGVEVGLEPKQEKLSANSDPAIISKVSDEKTEAFRALEELIRKDLTKIDPANREELLINQLTGEKLLRHFTSTYSQIFGSQIALLRSLEQSEKGMSLVELENYFKEVQSRYPELKDWDSIQYVRFLEGSRLLNKENGAIILTDIGADFLKWITSTGLSEARGL